MEAQPRPRYRYRRKVDLDGDNGARCNQALHFNGDSGQRSNEAAVFDKSLINRSGVTNLKRFFVERVHDTALKRRWQDLFRNITADIGGYDHLSEAQRQLARRAATLSLEAEKLERLSILGKPFEVELYCALSARLLSILGKLGVKRSQRQINETPQNLKSYLSNRGRKRTIELDGDAAEEIE